MSHEYKEGHFFCYCCKNLLGLNQFSKGLYQFFEYAIHTILKFLSCYHSWKCSLLPLIMGLTLLPDVCAYVLSCFSHVRVSATLWTVACQASLYMGFSRQEYWNGLLCPPPGYLSNLGIEPTSLMSPALASRFFITSLIFSCQ